MLVILYLEHCQQQQRPELLPQLELWPLAGASECGTVANQKPVTNIGQCEDTGNRITRTWHAQYLGMVLTLIVALG